MNFLQIINEKINKNVDFDFLLSIRKKLPYWNFYFFICIAETLNHFLNEEKVFSSEEDVINSMICMAEELYDNTNISTVFNLDNL